MSVTDLVIRNAAGKQVLTLPMEGTLWRLGTEDGALVFRPAYRQSGMVRRGGKAGTGKVHLGGTVADVELSRHRVGDHMALTTYAMKVLPYE